MTDPNQNQPTLDGLEIGEHLGPLRAAVATSIGALQTAGLLEPRHAGVAQLALEMADATQRGISSGRASAAAMAGAQLLAALQALPQPMDADTADRFAQLVAQLEAKVNEPRPK